MCASASVKLNASTKYQAQLFNHDSMYQNYLNNAIIEWKAPIDNAIKQSHLTNAQKMETVHYMYGYIAACLGKQDKEEARRVMNHMYTYLDALEKQQYRPELIQLYRSSLSVYEITFNKWKAMSYGKSSMSYMEKALALAPEHPLVVAYRGNVYFYMPSIAGGDKEKAKLYFTQSLPLFAKENNPMYKWNWIEARIAQAMCYEKTGDLTKAIALCQQILKDVPNHHFLSNTYYPQLLESSKKK